MKHAKEEDGGYADMIINVLPFSSSNIKTLCLSLYIFFLLFFQTRNCGNINFFLSAEMEMLVGYLYHMYGGTAIHLLSSSVSSQYIYIYIYGNN